MATHRQGDGFSTSPGRVYGAFALGLAAIVAVLGLISAVGVPDAVVGALLVGLTLCFYVVIGVLSRTMRVADYYVAGRRVPARYNGMAIGADWISATAFFGLAGAIYLLGQDGLAFGIGIAGGFVLTAILIAPYLRRAGSFTVPDFLATRFDAVSVRLIALAVLVVCSFVLLVAQLHMGGLVAARFLGLSYAAGVFISLACILLYTVPGGMRAVTWTQVAQYILLIAAFLVPVIWMSSITTGGALPLLTQGEVLQHVAALESALGLATGHATPFVSPGFDRLNTALLVLCLMAGTASLPHLLMRFSTARGARSARSAASWALLCVAIFLAAAPAYALFTRWAVLEMVHDGLTPDNIAENAGWLLRWSRVDPALVRICGETAADAATVAAACWSDGIERIGLADIALSPDIAVLAMPEIAGMPYIVSALLAAGGLAAALGAGAGLLLSIANTLAHDIHDRVAGPQTPTGRRLIAARLLLVAVGIIAAWMTLTRQADFLPLASWSFSLAAAGLFPALVLGVWWKRANWQGAFAGMLAGFAVTLYYLAATHHDPVGFLDLWSFLSTATPEQMTRYAELKAAWANAAPEVRADAWAALDTHARTIANWGGVGNLSAAAFGLPVGFVVMIAVSLVTKAPSQEARTFVSALHGPSDDLTR